MNLQDLQKTYQNEVFIEIEDFGNSKALVFTPRKKGDIDICSVVARKIGIDLIQKGVIKTFNAGVNAFLVNSEELGLKFYLLLEQLQSGSKEKLDLSFLYSSTPPHIEHILESYFPTGVPQKFIEIQSCDGYLAGSPTRFFEQFLGWSGVSTHQTLEFSSVDRNKNFANIKIVTKEHSDFQSNLTFQDFISYFNIKDFEWLHIGVGANLVAIAEGLMAISHRPKLISLDWEVFGSPLDLKNIFSSLGYCLDKIYMNHAFFIRAK